MNWARWMAVAGSLITVLVAVPATAASAAPGDCKTVTTKLTNRPDGGNGSGSWAVDTITRTVQVCQLNAPSASPTLAAKAAGPIAYVDYSVKATDEGTFVTNGGAALSPNNGVSLVAGRKGMLSGTFEFVVSAPVDFAAFNPPTQFSGTINGDPKTSPTDGNPGTSQWINSWWPDAKPEIKFLDNWSWIYWLCGDKPSRTNLAGFKGEYWWDAASPLSKDGTTPLSGDIRGVQVCPTASASVTPTPTATATVPPIEVSNNLPTTGAPVTKLVVGSVTVIVIGVGALLWGRRKRRAKFVA